MELMHTALKAACLCALASMAASLHAKDPSCWVFFGTQATDVSRGIYVSKLDQETGALSAPTRATDKPDSVFFAFAPDKRHLYALAEAPGPGGRPVEAIETYEVDAAAGALKAVGERVVGGRESCHISVDPSGRCVLTADYDGPYVEVFPILADSTVGERTSLVPHVGSGPNASRQKSAHPHSINVDPSDRYAIVADLGQDKVFVYRLDAAHGVLTPNDPPFAVVDPGAGPRHFAFHPDGKHAFVINEMGASITAFTWDREKGVLTPYQTVPILGKDYSGPTNTSAEVVVGKGGGFVYGSNRGDNSIVVHAFDPATGRLSFVQRITDGIQVPRNYAIDPSGKWLVCGNLTADTVTVYRIEPHSGRVALTGSIAVPEPLCVRFLQAD